MNRRALINESPNESLSNTSGARPMRAPRAALRSQAKGRRAVRTPRRGWALYLPCTFPVPSLYLPCTFPVPGAYSAAWALATGSAEIDVFPLLVTQLRRLCGCETPPHARANHSIAIGSGGDGGGGGGLGGGGGVGLMAALVRRLHAAAYAEITSHIASRRG